MPTPPLPVLLIASAAAAPIEATDPGGVMDPGGDNVPVEVDVLVEADSLHLLTGRVAIPAVPSWFVSSSDFGQE